MTSVHITSRPEKWWTEAIFHFYLNLNVFVHILENIKYTVTTTTGISLCCRIDSAFCKEIAMTWVYTVCQSQTTTVSVHPLMIIISIGLWLTDHVSHTITFVFSYFNYDSNWFRKREESRIMAYLQFCKNSGLLAFCRP